MARTAITYATRDDILQGVGSHPVLASRAIGAGRFVMYAVSTTAAPDGSRYAVAMTGAAAGSVYRLDYVGHAADGGARIRILPGQDDGRADNAVTFGALRGFSGRCTSHNVFGVQAPEQADCGCFYACAH